MGVVYRARDEVLDREVALKLVRPEVAQDEEVRHRFLREARLAAAINHPGVATLYEAGETEFAESGGMSQLYLASELVEGRNLEAVLGDGPLSINRVIDLGVQLADALRAAHELGIVHRDIKPSNLMVTSDEHLKVLDFGIAKRVGWTGIPGDDAETLTYTARGAIVGTPAYMAPEQVAGGVADARTDIHGAGCVLYQMLTGHGPFGSGAPSEVMRRVIVTPPKSLRSMRAEVPQPLADVVERALAKDPGDRYQSAEELATALRGAAASTGVRRALRGFGVPMPRRRVLTAAVAVVAVLSFFVGRKIFPTALPFDNRDWLLVTDVVNETDDEGFTLALKSALETDLRQSRHVNIFDDGQVRNTLKMMRRNPGSEIDLETGLDICRFAGVRALLVPRIDAALADYRLISELYPDASQPYNNSGRIYQGLGRYEEAARMYERALEVDPRNSIPMANQWFILNQYLRQPTAASEVARTLIDLQPRSPWTHHCLAWSSVALLERADSAGYDDPYFILVNPPLRSLQDRPELEQLAPPG